MADLERNLEVSVTKMIMNCLPANINCLFTCSNCGKMYSAMTERTDGLCPNCEPKPIPKIAPFGDIKTTISDLPNKDKLVKMH